MRVEVQVFAFDEPDLARTLDVYAAQEVPDMVDEIEYLAAVTPRESYRASMAEQAEAHEVFDLFETPPGKLASRNAAHDRAVGNGADVIVAGDADGPPFGREYLVRLLEPFADETVQATNSRPVAPWRTPLGAAVNVLGYAEDRVRPHLHGQGHALRGSAWVSAGPFDTDRDQTDSRAVRAEEEFAFRDRLEALGRVVDVPAAKVHNSPRRAHCLARQSVRTSQHSLGDYCERTVDSDVTFQPRSHADRQDQSP